MAALHDEKSATGTVEKLAQANEIEVKVVRGSEAFNEALLKERPSFRDWMTWRLLGCVLLGCFAQTMNGFDGSLFGGLSAGDQFINFFGQWSGNGALTYYLPAVLLTIGITDSIKQANVNLGYACFQFFFALAGAAFVERIGRRKLMLGSMASVTVTWIAMTAAAGTFNNTGETDQNAANAMLAFIFIFGACFSFGITPLQALYPVEVLSFEQRAKGMAFSALCVNAAGLLNAYAWPIALERIGWHTYIIFLIWCAIQFTVFYFFFPETRRRTLEELDKIFNSPNPVKTSLVPHKIAVDSEGTIVASEDI